MTDVQPAAFLGLSHLGLVAGAGWASFGGQVIGIDQDDGLIAALTASQIPVHEPGLGELLRDARPRMTFTADFASVAACPLVVLSHDVPTTDENRSDVSIAQQLLDRAIPHLRPRAAVVIMSQVPPGFTRSVSERIHRDHPDKELRVFYWVETLVLGRAVDRFLHPERIMLGCEEPAAPLPDALERGLRLFDCPVLRMRFESAELTKAAINLYLSCGVTFANTLSDLCERIGADWSEVVPALRLDARIGPAAYIQPSLGISGGNLERDLVTLRNLAGDSGVDASLIDVIVGHNARRLRWVLDKLESLVFAEIPVPTIALWGLAYKKHTQSLKNSPAVRVVSAIGLRANVRAYDPVARISVMPHRATAVSSKEAAVLGADCLLIMTDWDEFKQADGAGLRRVMRRPMVIDCVGALERRRGDLEGVRYISMGRGKVM